MSHWHHSPEILSKQSCKMISATKIRRYILLLVCVTTLHSLNACVSSKNSLLRVTFSTAWELFVFRSTSVHHYDIFSANCGLLVVFSQVVFRKYWNFCLWMFFPYIIFIKLVTTIIIVISILIIRNTFSRTSPKTKVLPWLTFREHILHNLVNISIFRVFLVSTTDVQPFMHATTSKFTWRMFYLYMTCSYTKFSVGKSQENSVIEMPSWR